VLAVVDGVAALAVVVVVGLAVVVVVALAVVVVVAFAVELSADVEVDEVEGEVVASALDESTTVGDATSPVDVSMVSTARAPLMARAPVATTIATALVAPTTRRDRRAGCDFLRARGWGGMGR